LVGDGGHDNKTIRLWDVNTQQQLGAMKGDHYFLSVAFSPDAKLIASGCGRYPSHPSACSVQRWDVQKMTAAANPFKGHTSVVTSVQFSPDGTRVASSSMDRTICIWDVERGTRVVGPLKGHTNSVRLVAFSPDGFQIVSCSYDGTVWLWDAREGRLIGNPYDGHTKEVNSVAFSPRGTYVVSGSDDKTVRLWDIRTGRQVDQPFQEHIDAVNSVAFSPCGQFVVSGSRDTKVIIRSTLANYPLPSNVLDSHSTGTRKSLECSQTRKGQQALRGSRYLAPVDSCSVPDCSPSTPDPLDQSEEVPRGGSDLEPSSEFPVPVEHMAPVDEGGLTQDEVTQSLSHMTTQQIFECLIAAGCIDLSPQMDTRQDTAIIVSGGGFGNIWVGQLHNGTKVAIKAWRTNALQDCKQKCQQNPGGLIIYDF
ncbi:WD40 domain protein, partial [Rhizoctonia solani AG-3 Rhs1AP]